MNPTNEAGSDRADSVQRSIVGSLLKLETVRGVSAEECLEGLVKAAAVYALQKMGDRGAVADLFEAFAIRLRELPEENRPH